MEQEISPKAARGKFLMSLTTQLRQDIDDISNYLFGGGYPDPVSNTEQLSFLFFFYLADGLDTQAQARARLQK